MEIQVPGPGQLDKLESLRLGPGSVCFLTGSLGDVCALMVKGDLILCLF